MPRLSPLFGFECAEHNSTVGVNDDEGPPVPIPNTEVKLVGGDNTCLATDREDSTMPTSDSSCEIAAAVFFIPVRHGLTMLGNISIIGATNGNLRRKAEYAL